MYIILVAGMKNALQIVLCEITARKNGIISKRYKGKVRVNVKINWQIYCGAMHNNY